MHDVIESLAAVYILAAESIFWQLSTTSNSPVCKRYHFGTISAMQWDPANGKILHDLIGIGSATDIVLAPDIS